jgi:chromosomal replication initiation ATPase DnaA
VKHADVDDEELRDALQANQFKEFLVFSGSQIPAYLADDISRLREQSGFAANSINNKIEEPISDVAKKYLNDNKKTEPWAESEPLAKRQALLFYSQSLHEFVPEADEDLWIYFDFCTANNTDETNSLGNLYRALIDQCQFEDFWKAMRDLTIMALLDRNIYKQHFAQGLDELLLHEACV